VRRRSRQSPSATRPSRPLALKALDRGLIVLSAGSYGQVVRIIPPLVTTAAEVDQALGIMAASMEAAGA
jgi:4-aminobutyrate aminotransferase-like enzyme